MQPPGTEPGSSAEAGVSPARATDLSYVRRRRAIGPSDHRTRGAMQVTSPASTYVLLGNNFGGYPLE